MSGRLSALSDASTMRSAIAAASPAGTRYPLTPSSITSGVPPTAVATTGTPARERFENDIRHALGVRRQHQQIEVRQKAIEVRPKAGQDEVLSQSRRVDLLLQARAFRPFAEQHESGRRMLAQHALGRSTPTRKSPSPD